MKTNGLEGPITSRSGPTRFVGSAGSEWLMNGSVHLPSRWPAPPRRRYHAQSSATRRQESSCKPGGVSGGGAALLPRATVELALCMLELSSQSMPKTSRCHAKSITTHVQRRLRAFHLASNFSPAVLHFCLRCATVLCWPFYSTCLAWPLAALSTFRQMLDGLRQGIDQHNTAFT